VLSRIKGILRRKKYKLFTRPYELNIVGLRSKQTRANKFDDEFHVFYRTGKKHWNYHYFKATTDPGLYWLKNPTYPKGTAILKEGQYINAYSIGLHAGKYKALVQVLPVVVMRDYDRNNTLDFKSDKLQSGRFGINIHHAKTTGNTSTIDKFSAGCQVLQSADDFNTLMMLCERHAALYGNEFTYTLIDYRAVRLITLKRVAIVATLLTSAIIGYLWKKGGIYENS
jgi:hypothetical protein